jgi:hypothetical protein
MVKMGVMALVFTACGGAGVPMADADIAMGFVPTRGSESALSPVLPVDAAPVAVSPVDAAPVAVSPVDAAPVEVDARPAFGQCPPNDGVWSEAQCRNSLNVVCAQAYVKTDAGSRSYTELAGGACAVHIESGAVVTNGWVLVVPKCSQCAEYEDAIWAFSHGGAQ